MVTFVTHKVRLVTRGTRCEKSVQVPGPRHLPSGGELVAGSEARARVTPFLLSNLSCPHAEKETQTRVSQSGLRGTLAL